MPDDEVKQEEKQCICEITVKAFSDGSLQIGLPDQVNIWVLQGMLAKALSETHKLEIKEQ
jgi:hypothetical protein